MEGSELSDIDSSIREIVEGYHESCCLDFKEFLVYYHGDLSDSSIVQYCRYLSYIDFKPKQPGATLNTEVFEDEDQEFSLRDFHRWGKKRFERLPDQTIDQTRFTYMTYLALKKYLEAIGQPELKKQLPSPDKMGKPKSNKQTFHPSPQQVEKVLKKADTEDLRLAIVLMAYSGLRIFEVLNLKAEFLEFKDDYVEIQFDPEYLKDREKVRPTDTAFLDSKYAPELREQALEVHQFSDSFQELREKIVDNEVVSRPLVNLSEDLRKQAWSDEGLESKTFKQLHRERQKANRELQKAARKAGLNDWKDITCHTLRRSFVHRIQDKTKDLSKTSQLARHGDPSVTERFYLQREKEEMAEAYQEAF